MVIPFMGEQIGPNFLTKALNRGKRGVDKAQAFIGLWTYLIEWTTKVVKGYIMNKYHPKSEKGMRFWILDIVCGFVLSCDIIGLELQ